VNCVLTVQGFLSCSYRVPTDPLIDQTPFGQRYARTVIYSAPLFSEICRIPGSAREHLSCGCIAASFAKSEFPWLTYNIFQVRGTSAYVSLPLNRTPPLDVVLNPFSIFYFILDLPDLTQIRFSYLNIRNWNIPLHKLSYLAAKNPHGYFSASLSSSFRPLVPQLRHLWRL